ncbi:hypothetical protein [Aureliella helgolandensis]|uniref:Uncharacterized protein n=1 Tax=Aureliella helgolandensis TaxID=2527968 RepID=A0A518GEI4_9BACT|nr:hypothetical protein [Aureliella helgolandensis]QDV26967.1 hypothetical protein Q31a_53470 [Aureliella helgolandensis]
MRKISLLLLIVALGCNSHEDSDFASSSETSILETDRPISIVAVPRPNSGQFSTDLATKLLPEFLAKSVAVSAMDNVVTGWKSPTQGIRIHVSAEDTVHIVDYLGVASVGLGTIPDALNSTMTLGNERSVLLTSDTTGWETPTKQKVVEVLFQPSVQIYIASGK